RLAGAQPAAPGRDLLPDPRPADRRARRPRGAGDLPRRQQQRLGAAVRRQLRAAVAGGRRAPALGPGRAAGGDLRMSPAAAAASQSQPLVDGDMLAAIDLGSNSYHMVVARYTLGQ